MFWFVIVQVDDMQHGEILVLFDGSEPGEEKVLPRYAIVEGKRCTVCSRPGTFLNTTVSYRRLEETFKFLDNKFKQKYDPEHVDEPPRSQAYGMGRQARRHKQANRARARSVSFSRVRLDFLTSYHVCQWMELYNKTSEEAVAHFRNLPLRASTIRNWVQLGGSKYYKRQIEKYGNRKSVHRGGRPVFHQEIELRDWVRNRERLGLSRGYDIVSGEAVRMQREWIQNENNQIRQKFQTEKGRAMTQVEESTLLYKNNFKASRTWYNAFLERQQLLSLSLSSTKKMTKEEWMHRMVSWLPQERFYFVTNHPWVLNNDGYFDRNQFFNMDEVPIQFIKKEGKQATTLSGRNYRTSSHRASTGDVTKRIATLILTIPMAPLNGPYINPLIDCKPYLIMKG